MQEDIRGHAMTTDNAAAAGQLSDAMRSYVYWRVDTLPKVKAALDADPEFALGHIVLGLLLHGGRNTGFRPKIAEALDAARPQASRLTVREQHYLAGLDAAYRGALTEFVAHMEQVLADNPRDLFAQRMAQNELFWLGEMEWSASISTRAGKSWDGSVPDYGVHLSCRAFDMEEVHEYETAERLAREGVERDPTDAWGTHAAAHVMIMQGRHDEGIAWLDGLKDNWADTNQMKLHLWWHRCLFHLERREFDAVLSIYDEWVRNRDLPLLQAIPDLFIDMQNGASMLKRLELQGVDVGDRWTEMADLVEPRLDDPSSPFTSAHYAMILAAAGRYDQAEALLAAMRAFAASDTGPLGARTRAAAIPAAEAAIAHRKGDFAGVIEALMPARRLLKQIGGSYAQRDIFFQLLADAARQENRRDIAAIVVNDAAAAGFADPQHRVGYREAAALL